MSEADVINCVECGYTLWFDPALKGQSVEPAANADGTDVTLTCPQCGRINVLKDWSGPPFPSGSRSEQ